MLECFLDFRSLWFIFQVLELSSCNLKTEVSISYSHDLKRLPMSSSNSIITDNYLVQMFNSGFCGVTNSYFSPLWLLPHRLTVGNVNQQKTLLTIFLDCNNSTQQFHNQLCRLSSRRLLIGWEKFTCNFVIRTLYNHSSWLQAILKLYSFLGTNIYQYKYTTD